MEGQPQPEKSASPTRKWWAATLTAVAGWVAILGAASWEFTDPVWTALIVLLLQRIAAYLVPNENTPGGVPTKKP